MELSADPQRYHNIPSAEDWTRLEPTIRQLYQEQRRTMNQVRDQLISLGYRVNTRMVRARITQWNLQRNNQMRDMVAALRLLDPNPALWSSLEPTFLVRGRQVTLAEVLRFFGRKQIRNPFEYARAAAHDPKADHVTLLPDTTGAANAPVDPGPVTALTPSNSSRCQPSVDSSSPGQQTPFRSLPMHFLTIEQRVVASLHDYCTAYIGLGQSATDQQPAVHRDTVHQRLAERIQEGLAHRTHLDRRAIVSFDRGFQLIEPLLIDCRPIALARVLSVGCQMAARGATQELTQLLWVFAGMAVKLRISRPIAQFLVSLYSAPHLLVSNAIMSLKAAVDIFSRHSPGSWHELYIQARLCDCLYHGRVRTEILPCRTELLQKQQAFYGPLARTVIWTMTNIANDFMNIGNIERGEEYGSMALMRSEQLTDFGRSEMRFAALRCLAKAERMRFESLCRDSDATTQRGLLSLQNAHGFLQEALRDADIWFDRSSYRVSSVRAEQQHIRSLLEGLGHQPQNSDIFQDIDTGLGSNI